MRQGGKKKKKGISPLPTQKEFQRAGHEYFLKAMNGRVFCHFGENKTCTGLQKKS